MRRIPKRLRIPTVHLWTAPNVGEGLDCQDPSAPKWKIASMLQTLSELAALCARVTARERISQMEIRILLAEAPAEEIRQLSGGEVTATETLETLAS